MANAWLHKMKANTKAYIALVYICLVWGTTYFAIRIGVLHYPAFLFAGVRQTVAGIILMIAALLLNSKKDLSRVNLLRQMLVGFLMLSVGNGCVTWGERFIPSGISALICCLMPLFVVLFNLASSGRDRFNASIIAGMVLGVCGVGLIFRHNLAQGSSPAYLGGILATILAAASWALGSIINKKDKAPVNAFLNSGMQLFFGGVFMLLFSPVADDYSGLVLWSTPGILALVYLIIFGSALAYAAYMYALSKLQVGIVTLYAYINPLIAVIAGYLFLNEELNRYTAMAFVTVMISVFLVNRGYRQQTRKDFSTVSKTSAAQAESARL